MSSSWVAGLSAAGLVVAAGAVLRPRHGLSHRRLRPVAQEHQPPSRRAARWMPARPPLLDALGRRRAVRRLEAQLPVVLEAIARSLRAGAALPVAIADAAASADGMLAADLARVAVLAERGSGWVAALDGWATWRPLPSVRLASAALALAVAAGGPQARSVDAVAVTVRQRLAVAAEARALAAQARYSAVVIAVAPIAFAAGAAALDSRSAHFLFRTPAGLLCVAAGLLLDAAGLLWMRRLMDGVA